MADSLFIIHNSLFSPEKKISSLKFVIFFSGVIGLDSRIHLKYARESCGDS